MIKNIVKDIEFLKIPSVDVTKDDLYIIDDLIDTLKYNASKCVGMAANMIGYSKNTIVVMLNKEILPMINPEIISSKDQYQTQEGCLSLEGVRSTTRFRIIRVKYFDKNFKIWSKTFKGFEAQIIQHEIDHLKGIII